MEAALAHLLDFSKPFDHALLDSLMAVAMDGKQEKAARTNVETLLIQLRDNADMWKRADTIIENCSNKSSKIYACTILIEAIQSRWRVIPQEQKEGIKGYVLKRIVAYSSTVESARENAQVLAKLNLTLVCILKQEWPHNWPTFIHELVLSAQASESLCENCMLILRLLSEEIFEFSKDQLTSTKARQLKEQLTGEFAKIFQLCEAVLGSPTSMSLVKNTLLTLQRFLTWIPVGYIFETSLIPALITNFLQKVMYRNETMLCLIEITALPLADLPVAYYPVLHSFLSTFLGVLQTILPRNYDLASSYVGNTDEEKDFISYVAQFLGGFLQNYYSVFEENGFVTTQQANIHLALEYMIMISRVDDDDLYKICLEYWAHFAKDMYTKNMRVNAFGRGGAAPLSLFGGSASPSPIHFLEDVIHELRVVTIDHMAKPEEVIIVADDNGDIIREKAKDSEVLVQYKTMRDTIVYLTNLNHEDNTVIMLEKLEQQVSYNFTHKGLNTLCWAIGSISGAMMESDEKTFLISVIRDLLKLCEETKGKNNKAVVASNIMYIVGQYPRFLRAHWKFLKTVVNKLFEFMHEAHPGVQDMSCDTFLKIAQKCKRKFITSQPEDDVPFILSLINDLARHTQDLQPHQVQSFYESVATMLSDKDAACPRPREEIIVRLMDIQNNHWLTLIALGRENPMQLITEQVAKEFLRILKLNNRVCCAAGSIYVHQLATFFNDASTLYRLYTEAISEAIKKEGELVIRKPQYKALRQVKVEFLDLMSNFFDVCHDLAGGPESCIPLFLNSLLSDTLTDYHTAHPDAREARVLTLLTAAINAFKRHLSSDMPRIMAAVFEPTLALITSNMTDHYEHRVGFFSFLRSANEHCFSGLFSIPAAQQKLIIESIVWAFKHITRDISEAGLEILLDLLKQVNASSSVAGPFYQTYMAQIIKEILAVLVDGQHKSGFKLHTQVLMTLCHSAMQPGLIAIPIFPPELTFESNAHYVKHFIETALASDFPNVSQAGISFYVSGLFDLTKDFEAFKVHVRDFLISSKEFSREDGELFVEEVEAQQRAATSEMKQYRATVRGLLRADELDDDEVAEQDRENY